MPTFPFSLQYNDYEMRMDYTTGSPPTGQPSYQGFAAPETPTNEDKWIIFKFGYSGNNMIRRQLRMKVSWDNRDNAF